MAKDYKNCPSCGTKNTIYPFEKVKGEKECSKCHTKFKFSTTKTYKVEVLDKIPNAGYIYHKAFPEDKYILKPGKNIIGRDGTTKVKRYEHDGKCYIGRKHCTINIKFDSKTCIFRYVISDGYDIEPSTNGTFIGENKLGNTFKIASSLSDGDEFNLGGEDPFILQHYFFPDSLKEEYANINLPDDEGTTE